MVSSLQSTDKFAQHEFFFVNNNPLTLQKKCFSSSSLFGKPIILCCLCVCVCELAGGDVWMISAAVCNDQMYVYSQRSFSGFTRLNMCLPSSNFLHANQTSSAFMFLPRAPCHSPSGAIWKPPDLLLPRRSRLIPSKSLDLLD